MPLFHVSKEAQHRNEMVLTLFVVVLVTLLALGFVALLVSGAVAVVSRLF